MANESEAELWTGPLGASWARNQADLDTLMAAVTEAVVERAALAPGQRVLDVGCGTGHSTLAAAERVAPGGEAVGLDLAGQLLAVARERVAGRPGLRFVLGDAQTARVAGAPFDAMISRFGVMFFDDPVAAFRNIATHLAPGAGLTFAAWAPVEANPWFHIPARIAAARVGKVAPVEPGAPGPFAFADAGRVLGLLRDAGLRDATVEDLALDLVHPGGVAAVASLAMEVGPATRTLRMAGAGDDDRAAVREGIAAALAPFGGPQGVSIPARVLLFRARA